MNCDIPYVCAGVRLQKVRGKNEGVGGEEVGSAGAARIDLPTSVQIIPSVNPYLLTIDMWWLSCLTLLALLSLVKALSSSGNRLLVVTEEVSDKTKYSTFWGDLEGMQEPACPL